MSVLIVIFEIIGTVAFSISGVIVAQKKKMDLLGVLIMGLVTAVGGGITRDIFFRANSTKGIYQSNASYNFNSHVTCCIFIGDKIWCKRTKCIL